LLFSNSSASPTFSSIPQLVLIERLVRSVQTESGIGDPH
jgi:hypothetical protein